jgi:hypothetical protein
MIAFHTKKKLAKANCASNSRQRDGMFSHVYVLLLPVVIIALSLSTTSAQVSAGGKPMSFSLSLTSAVPAERMASIDVAGLLLEDSIEAELGLPFRFGYPLDVNLGLDNSGAWDVLPNGDKIWRLQIDCPGAYSINLIYSRYRVPEGAKFFVYGLDRSVTLGAFTSRNNKDHGQFSTAPIPGESCVLEYIEPEGAEFPGELTVSTVVHAYKNVFGKDAKGFGQSGSCNINVNCPDGVNWQEEKRAVAMILTQGGSRICSGALVNNVEQDMTPYFLTANHCLGGETTWIFMFNYESPSCANVNGPTDQTVSGSTRLANYSSSDFALLLLSEAPPPEYDVRFAGWSRVDEASPWTVGIHHPSGDIKKISFNNDAVTSTNYLTTSGTTHWRIDDWELGTTEGGSSGSPLFDNNHRIVGQLHGGYASCTSITSDWYGKFSYSWNGGGSSSSRLRDWLDPNNTGALHVDGSSADADNDGIANSSDNCPKAYNPGQDDVDSDSIGDACDNCPTAPNADQADRDGDTYGDVCDPDADGDGLLNESDNCMLEYNPDQIDTDADSVGDLCDNCPLYANPEQYDENDDGTGDACDGLLHIQSYPTEVPPGYVGEPYYYRFRAIGGVEPYTWQKLVGAQPYGCTLTQGDSCVVSGTPSFVANYFLTIELIDSDVPAPNRDTVTVSIPVTARPHAPILDEVGPQIVRQGDVLDLVISASDVDLTTPSLTAIGLPQNSSFVDSGNGVGLFTFAPDVGQLGEYTVLFVASDGDLADSQDVVTTVEPFLCGDANRSGFVDIDDVMSLVYYVFAGGPVPSPYEAGNADCAGIIDVDDVVYVITYIFASGPVPCAGCQ